MKKEITLNNGLKMPVLGFGVFQIPDFEECKQAVLTALKQGYRLIDTAAAYGNERAVGAAIRESGIAREEIFVTTKLWVQDAGYEQTQAAIQASLTRLGLDYIDLYLIHQPLGDVYGSWRAMEAAYHDGQLKALGVANFENDRLQDLIMHNEVKPTVDQIELHPFYQQPQRVQWLLNHDIVPEAWAPFAEGKNDIFKNPVLTKIGDKYSKSVAQVILRWLIEQDIVVLAKSVKPERMRQNLDVFDFELTDDDKAQIATLNDGESQFFSHADPKMIKWMAGRRLEV